MARVAEPLLPHYFVLAPSFHGATLLALLLGNHPDLVALGDTNPSRPDAWCSCGRRLADCPVWAAIAHEVSPFTSVGTKMLPTVPDLTANPSVNVRLTAALSTVALHSSANVWRVAGRRFEEYTRAWARFRDAAVRVGGAKFMVDGEKSVTKFLAFRSAGTLDARLIHLTRDPRGFVHSFNRHRVEKGRQEESLPVATSLWIKGHQHILRAARGLEDGRYLHVRYEDLAEHPAETMERMFWFMGLANRDVCRSPVNAHVIGNRMASSFSGEIKLDTTWEGALSTDDQARVCRLAEPLFSSLGYRIDEQEPEHAGRHATR
jgi:sulfotransferase family protein